MAETCSKPDKDRLIRVMRELIRFHGGFFPIEKSTLLPVPAGYVPVPQTSPRSLMSNLSAAPPELWREMLATEILLYLKTAHLAGHAEAAPDALLWCAKYGLRPPGWLNDAPLRVSRQGKGSVEKQLDQFWNRLGAYLVIRIEEIVIAYEEDEETLAALDLVTLPPRKKLRGSDKFERAREHVGLSWKGTRKAYYNLAVERRYFSPNLLMKIFRSLAPTLYELLR